MPPSPLEHRQSYSSTSTHSHVSSNSKPSQPASISHRPVPSESASKWCGGSWLASANKAYNIRVAGPSMAGKTALIRFLQHGQFTETTPTNEMEVSRVFWRGTPLLTWDSRKLNQDDLKPAVPMTPNLAHSNRPLVAARQTMDAVVYVVDASDPGRLKIAGRDFERFLKSYHKIPVVLVIGTKRDVSQAVDQREIRAQLRMLEAAFDRECAVSIVSTVTGEGIEEAMDWLLQRVTKSEHFLSPLFRMFGCQGSSSTEGSRWGKWDPFSMCRYSRLG